MEVNWIDLEDVKQMIEGMINHKFKEGDLKHIEYDPKLDEDNKDPIDPNNEKNHCDIRIIRSTSHDGTLLFTHEVITNAYLPLINKTVNHKDYPEKIPNRYLVGKMRIEHHTVDFQNEHGIKMTQRDKVSIPVKFIY